MEIKILLVILGSILGFVIYHIFAQKVMNAISEIIILIAEEKIQLKKTDIGTIAVGVRQDDYKTMARLDKNIYFKYIKNKL